MYKLSRRVNFKIDDYELSLIRRLAELERETLSNEIRKIIRRALAENNLLGQYIPRDFQIRNDDHIESEAQKENL